MTSSYRCDDVTAICDQKTCRVRADKNVIIEKIMVIFAENLKKITNDMTTIKTTFKEKFCSLKYLK